MAGLPLDTRTLLWLIDDSARLSDVARQMITDAANPAYLSAASAWDIAIKTARGSIELSAPATGHAPRMRMLHQLEDLPILEAHAVAAGELAPFHRDPFDRMLVAQARIEGLAIVTPDPVFREYPARVIW
jgi:PIN domain nuclease of toxin-antitoxin system